MALDPLEKYLRELRSIRGSGSWVPETSYYPALRDLMNEVGAGWPAPREHGQSEVASVTERRRADEEQQVQRGTGDRDIAGA